MKIILLFLISLLSLNVNAQVDLTQQEIEYSYRPLLGRNIKTQGGYQQELYNKVDTGKIVKVQVKEFNKKIITYLYFDGIRIEIEELPEVKYENPGNTILRIRDVRGFLLTSSSPYEIEKYQWHFKRMSYNLQEKIYSLRQK